ncbi:AAA ATPase-like protein [Actinophytocola oryzae]|uniref:AAA ATPase-like protein n=1 Tax=Actinophytocola oryzae TaxID=502181 RepID=A0A4R7US35_9PSEU|nr:AAA ATPase-like protein [Actinophytocola oryzae]
MLHQLSSQALDGGTGLVIVEGEPGVGKTRLLEEATAEADRRGALVAWGHCLDDDEAPPMWPWMQALGTVLDDLPATTRERWQDGELRHLFDQRAMGLTAPAPADDDTRRTRFDLFEQVVTFIGQVSAERPVVLVIDDLQRADVASLRLFDRLAARMLRGTVIVGVLRDRVSAHGGDLSRTLATASRVPGHCRIRLGPLCEAEVAELVRLETGKDPGADVARTIHARTAGNPFFVRELSRLLAGRAVLTEEAASTGVPSTVHDVVRDRMAGLDHDSRELLRLAASIGREVDLDLLARAAGLDIGTCLARLEPRRRTLSARLPPTRSRSGSSTTWSANRSPRPHRPHGRPCCAYASRRLSDKPTRHARHRLCRVPTTAPRRSARPTHDTRPDILQLVHNGRNTVDRPARSPAARDVGPPDCRATGARGRPGGSHLAGRDSQPVISDSVTPSLCAPRNVDSAVNDELYPDGHESSFVVSLWTA